MMQTVRHFGRQRLTETGEAMMMEARHADYFVTLVRQRSNAIQRDPAALGALVAQIDDVRAALLHVERHRPAQFAEAVFDLRGLWTMHNAFPREAREQIRRALLAIGDQPTVMRARLFTLDAYLAVLALDPAGLEVAERARTVVDAAADAWSTNWMAFVDWRHAVLAGDPRLALDIARSNLDGLVAAGDVVAANVTRFFLSLLWASTGVGDPRLPYDTWERGVVSCEAMELHIFGIRQLHDGDLVGCLAAMEQTVVLVESRPTTGIIVGPSWFGLALVSLKVGRDDLDPARFLRRAEELRAAGEHYAAPMVEAGAAMAFAARGDIDGALASLERARQDFPKMADVPVLAVGLHLAKRNRDAARQEVAELTAHAARTESPLLRCRALWLTGILERDGGEPAPALRNAVAAAALAASHGLTLEQINALDLAADLLGEAGHADVARRVSASVASARARMHYPWRIVGPPRTLEEPSAPTLSLDEATELAASRIPRAAAQDRRVGQR